MKASVVGAVALLGPTGFAHGAVEGEKPEGALSLHNTHTGETLEVTYRDPSGHYVPEALEGINRLLRCHYTGQVADIDVGVIEFLNAVDKRLGGGLEIHVISGYRSPVYNDLLVRQGRDVAKHSFHVLGKALDVRFPRISLGRLRRTALDLGSGGVGFYPRSGFVHLDSGPFRFW